MFKSDVDDEKITLIEKITLSSTEVLQQFSIFQVLFHFPFFQSPSLPPKKYTHNKKDFPTHIKIKIWWKIFKSGKKTLQSSGCAKKILKYTNFEVRLVMKKITLIEKNHLNKVILGENSRWKHTTTFNHVGGGAKKLGLGCFLFPCRIVVFWKVSPPPGFGPGPGPT